MKHSNIVNKLLGERLLQEYGDDHGYDNTMIQFRGAAKPLDIELHGQRDTPDSALIRAGMSFENDILVIDEVELPLTYVEDERGQYFKGPGGLEIESVWTLDYGDLWDMLGDKLVARLQKTSLLKVARLAVKDISPEDLLPALEKLAAVADTGPIGKKVRAILKQEQDKRLKLESKKVVKP